MLRISLKRVILLLPLLLGVCTLTFLLIHLIPGDPIDILLGDNATSIERAALERRLGLDQPLLRQYSQFIFGLLRGDLGESFQGQKPVANLIGERWMATFELGFFSMFLALLWGIPIGVFSATQSPWMDRITMALALLFISIPGIFLGPMLIWLFALKFPLFPVSERGGIEHLILPAVSLALPLGAVILRMTKSTVSDLLHEDYVRTAIAKGASPHRVFFIHVLKNALIPIITLIGLQIGAVLTGTVITETIFDWPGLGTLLLQAIYSRDYPLIQGCVLVIALTYVVVNLLTDLAYIFADPAMRKQS